MTPPRAGGATPNERKPDEPIRLICPRCRSRLEVIETASGGRTVSVVGLSELASSKARALEVFTGRDGGPDITCPACNERFDPATPYRVSAR